MDTSFLDRLAQQLRIDKTPSCRRAINRILDEMKQRYESGQYNTPMAAESDFREFVEKDLAWAGTKGTERQEGNPSRT
jgi:hypothetical protein